MRAIIYTNGRPLGKIIDLASILSNSKYKDKSMVIILDGNSEIGAHVKSNLCFPIV